MHDGQAVMFRLMPGDDRPHRFTISGRLRIYQLKRVDYAVTRTNGDERKDKPLVTTKEALLKDIVSKVSSIMLVA